LALNQRFLIALGRNNILVIKTLNIWKHYARLIGVTMKFMRELLRIIDEAKEKDDPCWKGYKQLGTKKKNGKTVPNCVKCESEDDNKNVSKS
jgi:hypothetical protein